MQSLLSELYRAGLESRGGFTLGGSYELRSVAAFVDGYCSALPEGSPAAIEAEAFFDYLGTTCTSSAESSIPDWPAYFNEACDDPEDPQAPLRLLHTTLWQYLLASPPRWLFDFYRAPRPSQFGNFKGPLSSDVRHPEHMAALDMFPRIAEQPATEVVTPVFSFRDLLEHVRAHFRELIRQGPVRLFRAFIDGYDRAFPDADTDARSFYRQFHDWVAYRLHYAASTSGWCGMIQEAFDTEETRFEKFYSLVDQFFEREPHTVAWLETAPLRKSSGNGINVYTSAEDSSPFQDPSENDKVIAPRRLRLVRYTDDPGFFVCCDQHPEEPPTGFWRARYLWSLGGVREDTLEVVDEEGWASCSAPQPARGPDGEFYDDEV